MKLLWLSSEKMNDEEANGLYSPYDEHIFSGYDVRGWQA